MDLIKQYKLEIIVFVSGAVVMVLEMAGSRVFAPYLGTSIYIWTSLIGVIMGSLSLGYYWGGRLADKGANYKTLSKLLLIAGALVLLMDVLKDLVLNLVASGLTDPKTTSVFASLVLFAPPSVLLGMVSPYAVRLKIDDLKTSGTTVGNLYAISTVGSIVGTFLSGFVLIAFFGTSNIILILALTLIVLAIFTNYSDRLTLKLVFLVVSMGAFAVSGLLNKEMLRVGFIDKDTMYNRVWIFNSKYGKEQKLVRRMNLNKQNASAMYLDGSEDIVFDYQKFYNLIGVFNPEIKSAVLYGGAAYSYPKQFLKQFPLARMDVVEIDPGLTALAEKYFNLKMSDRLGVFHEDARVFLNRGSAVKYDAAFMDAFDSYYSLPNHLTTLEAVQKISDSLNDKGILFTNLISSFEGDKSGFFKAEYATYKKVFPQVYAYQVKKLASNKVQNIVLIAFKDKDFKYNFSGISVGSDLGGLYKINMTDSGMILTDEFAPIEKFFINIT
jgi:spermidine synthase